MKTEFSKSQLVKLAEYRSEWTKIGLASGDADLAAATPAINRLYALLGKPSPVIWRFSSPLVAQLFLNSRAQMLDQMSAQMSDQMRAQMSAQMIDQMRAQMIDQKLKYYYTYFWGSLDAYWIVYYKFALDEFSLKNISGENVEKLRLWETLAKSCGYIYFYENFCVICDRPESVWDEQNRLHNVSGPAIRFSDGWSIYNWHGIPVDARLIDSPESITIGEIETEANAEKRRAMISQYEKIRFPGAYLVDCGAQEIHHDKFGILYRKEFLDDEPMVMVRLLNRTPEPDGNLTSEQAKQIFGSAAWFVDKFPEDSRWKEYYKRVHPELRPMFGNDAEGRPVFGDPQKPTARGAVASTRAMYAEQYHPEAGS